MTVLMVADPGTFSGSAEAKYLEVRKDPWGEFC